MSGQILVTGGSGFIGSALVRRLVTDDRQVRVLDDGSRGQAGRLRDLAGPIEVVDGDVRDAATVERAAVDTSTIIHLAAINGTSNFYTRPDVVLDVGVRGILNVVAAAKRSGAELFVASSSEVYQAPPRVPTDERVPLVIPDPHNPRFSYAASKLISEVIAINFGRTNLARVVIFRPHNVYGPDMGWEHVIPQLSLRVRELARTPGTIRLPIEGTGAETRAFTYIDDAVDGIVLLLDGAEHLGIYNVGVEEEISIADVATRIGRRYGRDIEIAPTALREGSTPRRCPDTTKLRALGFAPRVDFDAGLERTAQWYDDHADERPEVVAPAMPR